MIKTKNRMDLILFLVLLASLVFFFASFCGEVFAEEVKAEKQEIVVKTESGEPIKGAVFELRDSNQNILETIVTDENGVGKIVQVSDGTYQLVQKKTSSGYQIAETNNSYVVKTTDPITQTQIINKSTSSNQDQSENTTSDDSQDNSSTSNDETLSLIEYKAKVASKGWQDSVKNGETAGTTGQSLALQALQIKSNISGVGISYQVHVQDIGWQDEVSDGKTAGTEGNNKQIEAIKIRLTGENAANYKVYYRVHVADFGWLGWAEAGEMAGTTNYGLRVEAIEIKVLPKDTTFDTDSTSPSITTKAKYQVYQQNNKWLDPVTQGKTGGTANSGLRLEAIKITRSDDTADVSFSTNVKLKGGSWQGWKNDNEMAGTTGKSQAIQSIKIKLSSNGKAFNVYYRVYVSNVGWLGWAKNCQEAGCNTNQIEAIQIKILPSSSVSAPETGNSYRKIENKVSKGDLGIDVSEWNGNNNWTAIRNSGIKFVFIRSGFGYSGNGRVDHYFKQNYNGAKSAGLAVGVYHYSYATSTAEAKKEAELCISALGGGSLDLPIAFDAEDTSTLGSLSKSQITDIICTFCDTVQAAGYQPMVYANLNWLNNKIDYSRISKYKIWFAQYNSVPSYSNHYDFWQYSSTGHINGVGSPNVDLNRANSNF